MCDIAWEKERRICQNFKKDWDPWNQGLSILSSCYYPLGVWASYPENRVTTSAFLPLPLKAWAEIKEMVLITKVSLSIPPPFLEKYLWFEVYVIICKRGVLKFIGGDIRRPVDCFLDLSDLAVMLTDNPKRNKISNTQVAWGCRARGLQPRTEQHSVLDSAHSVWFKSLFPFVATSTLVLVRPASFWIWKTPCYFLENRKFGHGRLSPPFCELLGVSSWGFSRK